MRLPRFVVALAVVATAALPLQAPAQVESTPIPAPSKPNFSSMQFMVGTWTCRTKSARRPAAYVTTSTYSMDPSGYWLNETSTVTPTSWIARKLTTWDKITYDNDSHRWVDVSYGDGGAYGLSVSKGWNGDKIAWRDLGFEAGPDIKSQTDIVTTKVSNTQTKSSSTFTEAKSGRVVSVTTVCTKQ